MKVNKYFYMGLGAIVALALAAFGFNTYTSAQAAEADNGIVFLQLQDDGIEAAIDGSEDIEHRRGKGKGKRGFGSRDNSALIEELGVTQEEWDAAKEATQAEFEDAEEKPDRETVTAFFADQLGVTVEELEAAQEAVKEARLAEALANGDITQEQIDAMEARQAVFETIDKTAIAADILGLTVEEVEAGNLRDLIEESGLSRAELSEAMQAAYADAIAQAVEDGVITQEQADLIEDNSFGRKGFGNRGNSNRGNGQRGIGGVSTGDA